MVVYEPQFLDDPFYRVISDGMAEHGGKIAVGAVVYASPACEDSCFPIRRNEAGQIRRGQDI